MSIASPHISWSLAENVAIQERVGRGSRVFIGANPAHRIPVALIEPGATLIGKKDWRHQVRGPSSVGIQFRFSETEIVGSTARKC
jgi:hypothetical protein